ncbi:MAG: hypothetical protein KME07_12450 [Pegethrix bostrychoides GSE-TBD4-15B]|uniref:Uncharacterized protein n=1 Tax=Pegethrix bostrychoides GSE-TBD4-15B TaxID=2839662 RepID=A0A951U542_9CYAN|nr:hypothetical protein [Pegethrix bostrychoides GSE-TBD4-15B]
MVFKFLNKGKGKKSEFFLEAPPLSHEAEAKLAEVKHIVEAKVDELKETAVKVTDAIEEKIEQKVDRSALAQDIKAKVAPEAKTKKFKNAKAAEAETAESKAARRIVAQPAPEPVKNFATDFLMPSATPRRRPGPSLDMFRDMAKDVNPRR